MILQKVLAVVAEKKRVVNRGILTKMPTKKTEPEKSPN